jgi:hypothetical protein
MPKCCAQLSKEIRAREKSKKEGMIPAQVKIGRSKQKCMFFLLRNFIF